MGTVTINSAANATVQFTDSFKPSSYTGNVNATTTVSGQSGAVAIGATRFRVQNLDDTNFAYFAFGTSLADAETNAASGVAIELGESLLIGVPANATHYAFLGDTSTVVLNISQGV